MKLTDIRLCYFRPMGVIPNAVRDLHLLALLGLVAACRPGTAPAPEPVPVPAADVLPPIPPMPLVEGQLQPKVVYPRADMMIQSRDSNFILGSVGNGNATLTINGQQVRVWPNGSFLGWVANPAPTAAPTFELVAAVGADTARLTHPVRVAGMPVDTTKPLPPPPPSLVVTDTTPTWVILGDSASAASDTDRVIIARPGPNTVYKWFLLPGTRAQVTARYPGFARIRLDSALQVWVEAVDAKTLAADTTPPRRVVQNARVRSGPDYQDLVLPMNERPAYHVDERDREIVLMLYDTRGSTDNLNYPTSDSLIKHVEWIQEASNRARYSVRLNQQPFGFLVWYENGALILRVRRAPVVIPSAAFVTPSAARGLNFSALRGLRIVVDPGHPPAGATGPTGFYEADGALPVGFALKRILEERGAEVVMTRTTRDAVDLQARPVMARQANGHAFVSLHYNAYGDGINPFTQRNGMEVYFFRPHSESLARAVQTSMLKYIDLPDQGVYYRSLAVVRNTWMPAVLVEGGFIIMPDQEHMFRTPEFQERYARAVADGLEAYFRVLRAP
jgi:N-acetylmuramoyl-L-alanine amidase